MVTTIGPAVGAKAQFGFSEESKWGYPMMPPTGFFEFTSEGIVSEYTNLSSAALRSDRAVHKQRIATEAAGGDVNFELGPEGLGTVLKHSFGKKRTKRRDIAFVIVYTGGDTDRALTITSTNLTTSGTTTNHNCTSTFYADMGINKVMDDINEADQHWCYSPWGADVDTGNGYFNCGVSDKGDCDTTCGVADFGYTHAIADGSGVGLLEACTSIPMYTADATNTTYGFAVFTPVYYVYGIYDHTIDTHADLPEVTEGLSIEVGRDVAAFNYYGAKVNSLAINATPGEIVTGTASFMAKGASTNGDPVAAAGNAGWNQEIVDIALHQDAPYTGDPEASEITVEFDETTNFFALIDDSKLVFKFPVTRGYHDYAGNYYHVSTIGGFMDFLTCCGWFSLTHKIAVNYNTATSDIDDLPAAAITTGSSQTLLLDATLDSDAVPIVRGDYKFTDAGTSINVGIKINAAGTGFMGSGDGSTYQSDDAATLITAGVWYDILNSSGVDTGFDVMFPIGTSWDPADSWLVASFKDENSGASGSYSERDPFVGAQGAVTVGGLPQPVMGLSFTINNNLYGDKYHLGDKQRAALKEQQMSVEGSINTEFDDLDLYRKFVNGIATDMLFTFTSDEYVTSDSSLGYSASTASDIKYGLSLRFPNLKYSGTTPTAGGPEIMVTDYPFVALYDDANSIPNVRIVLTNHIAYI